MKKTKTKKKLPSLKKVAKKPTPRKKPVKKAALKKVVKGKKPAIKPKAKAKPSIKKEVKKTLLAIPKQEKLLLPTSYPEPTRKKIRLVPGKILTARGYIQLLEKELTA